MTLRYLDVTPPRPPMRPIDKVVAAGLTFAAGVIVAKAVGAVFGW